MKKLILLTMFLLMIPLAVAIPPVTGGFTTGYEIETHTPEVIMQGRDHDFNFHVFDIGNGTPVSNANTDCTFHMYNASGFHVIEIIAGYDITNVMNEFHVEVDGENFTENGEYSYIVQCNGTEVGGFTRVNFDVNPSGIKFDDAQAILNIGLLGILVFLFMVCLFTLSKLPSKNVVDPEGELLSINKLKYLRPVFWVGSYVLFMTIMFVSSNLAIAFSGSSALFGDLFFDMYRIMFLMLLPMVTIWFVYLLYRVVIDFQAEAQVKRIGGGI